MTTELLFRLAVAGAIGLSIGVERNFSGRRLAIPAFFLLAVAACAVVELATAGGELLRASPQTLSRVVVALGLVVAAVTLWFRGRSQVGLTTASALVVLTTGLLIGFGDYWLALAIAAVMLVFLLALGPLRRQE
jgi:uncharacterized membrane protein YhiD involved in acid resistance